jgi:AraC family transcriptional regulator
MPIENFVAHTSPPPVNPQVGVNDRALRHPAEPLYREQKWRQMDRDTETGMDDVAISRWNDSRSISRLGETITPSDRYIVAIALRTTRLKLTRGRQIIFDGIMPAGTVHVSAPSQQISSQFQAPFDFLHLHIPADCFLARRTANHSPDDRNDLIVFRDSFAEQLARALISHEDAMDRMFARCIGQTLALHVARLEPPRTKVNALPKWRLRRVEEYVRSHFDRPVSLSDLAKVAGLSRMHFAAQFRAATGFRPREYLLHQRVEHAKSLLSSTELPLAEVALVVGFCAQAHFSTVFKRIAGETPARWRSARKWELLSTQSFPETSGFNGSALEVCGAGGQLDEICAALSHARAPGNPSRRLMRERALGTISLPENAGDRQARSEASALQ